MFKASAFTSILSLNVQYYHLASLKLVKKEITNHIKIG